MMTQVTRSWPPTRETCIELLCLSGHRPLLLLLTQSLPLDILGVSQHMQVLSVSISLCLPAFQKNNKLFKKSK